MLKKFVMMLSLLALVAQVRAQEEDFDFDDAGGDTSSDFSDSADVSESADVSDTAEAPDLNDDDAGDFSDSDVSETDFGDDLNVDQPATDTAKAGDPENVVEPIAPAETETPPIEAPVVEAAPPEPLIPDTDVPPSNATMGDGVAFGDSPDLEYEAQLYDIYLNFNSKPMSDGDWSKMLSDRTVENYRIQKGDNLWGISQTIFGDGNYWPKIWSINRKIKNPHLIEPQNSIKFLLGDESGPPAFTVSEAEAAPGTAEQTVAEAEPQEAANGSVEPEIPPPAVRGRPVVKRLPPSLPQWQDPQSVNSKFDSAGIEFKRRKIADVIDSIPLSAYISEAPPEALGKVVEVETGNQLASLLQYVYVTIKGDANIGDKFLAVSNRGRVEKTTPLIKDSFLGYGIDVLGEIRLDEKVNGENERENGKLYRAMVTKIVNPVQVGAILTLGKIEQVNLSETNLKSQVVAQIVGGQLFKQRQVYGPESVAFLNKGENAGLAPGQMLPIRAYRKLRNDRSIVTGNVNVIGWLKVLQVTPRFSTAVVLRAWSDVLSGDLTGAGDMSSLSINNSSVEAPTQTSLLKEMDGEGDAEPTQKSGDDDSFDDPGEEDIGGDADFSEDDMGDGDF